MLFGRTEHMKICNFKNKFIDANLQSELHYIFYREHRFQVIFFFDSSVRKRKAFFSKYFLEMKKLFISSSSNYFLVLLGKLKFIATANCFFKL